ncbi:MAG: hypothetical protein WC797_01280 [Candidatus Paceibacterota bacterium]|jgi:hypothetical protein
MTSHKAGFAPLIGLIVVLFILSGGYYYINFGSKPVSPSSSSSSSSSSSDKNLVGVWKIDKMYSYDVAAKNWKDAYSPSSLDAMEITSDNKICTAGSVVDGKLKCLYNPYSDLKVEGDRFVFPDIEVGTSPLSPNMWWNYDGTSLEIVTKTRDGNPFLKNVYSKI